MLLLLGEFGNRENVDVGGLSDLLLSPNWKAAPDSASRKHRPFLPNAGAPLDDGRGNSFEKRRGGMPPGDDDGDAAAAIFC